MLTMPIEKDLSEYSVLMSVYMNDKPEYVKMAVDSMLNQTVSPEQFVIVVDGLISDVLESVIRTYEDTAQSIFTIVRLEQNGGLGNALNQGMKVCRNELVARMDADDISMPDRCEKQVKRFQENPSLCILGGQIEEFIDNPSNIESVRVTPTDFEGILRFAKRRSPFNHVSVMYRKSVIDKLGGYGTFKRKEDLELFIRAVYEGYYSENLSDVLVKVRVGEGAMGRRKSWKNCKEYIDIMKCFYDKGYIGVKDMAYVFFGQMSMFLLPPKITSALSRKYLRG